jgi:hypothetical protein
MILESPMPITINHDWSRVYRIYSKLVEQCKNGVFDNIKKLLEDDKIEAYDIGWNGRITMSTILTEDPWYLWTGSLLESVLPWIPELKKYIEKSNLKFQGFTYGCHNGDIRPHIDPKETQEIEYRFQQCNINFVIESTDPTATTFFERSDGIHYYLGKKNQAYLLDGGVPHWVTNNGHRVIFQLRFHDDYHSIKTFFENNPLTLP